MASGAARGFQREHQPDDRGCERLADADRVRADQVELKGVELVFADAGGGELAEAGVDAVGGGVALGGFLDDGGAGTDGMPGLLADGEGLAAGVQGVQVFEGELAGFE